MLLDYAIGLRTTRGQLELQSSPPRLSVQQQPADLSIRNPGTQLAMRTTPLRLSIDSTQPRAELGFYTYQGFIRNAQQANTRAAGEAIAQIVAAGDAYQAVERDSTAILTQNTGPEPSPDWELAFKPLTPPSISFTPGTLTREIGYRPPEVQVSAHPPIIDVQVVPTRISYTPGALQTFLRPVQGNLGDLLDLSA